MSFFPVRNPFLWPSFCFFCIYIFFSPSGGVFFLDVPFSTQSEDLLIILRFFMSESLTLLFNLAFMLICLPPLQCYIFRCVSPRHFSPSTIFRALLFVYFMLRKRYSRITFLLNPFSCVHSFLSPLPSVLIERRDGGWVPLFSFLFDFPPTDDFFFKIF